MYIQKLYNKINELKVDDLYGLVLSTRRGVFINKEETQQIPYRGKITCLDGLIFAFDKDGKYVGLIDYDLFVNYVKLQFFIPTTNNYKEFYSSK